MKQQHSYSSILNLVAHTHTQKKNKTKKREREKASLKTMTPTTTINNHTIHHCNNSADKFEEGEMLWVDSRGWVDLQSVAVLAGVLE